MLYEIGASGPLFSASAAVLATLPHLATEALSHTDEEVAPGWPRTASSMVL
jgi:hypothetical protein